MGKILFNKALFGGKSSSGGGSGGQGYPPDNRTIALNSNDELYAYGLKQKNGGYVYDWIGSLSQYQQAVAGGTIQSDWMCYITDDTVAEGTPAGPNLVQLTDTETITLEDNTIYNASSAIVSLTITIPTGIDNTFISEVDFSTGSSLPQFIVSGTVLWSGDSLDGNGDFEAQVNSRYVIMFTFDGVNNIALVKKTV